MRLDILSIFPEFIDSFKDWSMIKKALDEGFIEINNVDIRDFTEDKHNKVDDYPFGGGPGMLMTIQPIYHALKSLDMDEAKVIYLSPQGKTLTQQKSLELSKEKHIILLAGHYEGIDNRIIENFVDEEISIGDFVLTGGELPAMVVMDSIIRLIPGVLGSNISFEDESHYGGLLEHPQYTRPRSFQGLEVPDVLLSGNHKEIEKWKLRKSIETTLTKRPDLIENKKLSKEELKILKEIKSKK